MQTTELAALTNATQVRLTAAGWAKVREAAPGHVDTVREYVLDGLTADQVDQLREITDAMLRRPDAEQTLSPVYRRHDP